MIPRSIMKKGVEQKETQFPSLAKRNFKWRDARTYYLWKLMKNILKCAITIFDQPLRKKWCLLSDFVMSIGVRCIFTNVSHIIEAAEWHLIEFIAVGHEQTPAMLDRTNFTEISCNTW